MIINPAERHTRPSEANHSLNLSAIIVHDNF